MQKFILIHLILLPVVVMVIDYATGQGIPSSTSSKSPAGKGDSLFSLISTSTTEDWRMAVLATLTSPKPTTTKKPPELNLSAWMRSLYTRYGIVPTTTQPSRLRTRPLFDYDSTTVGTTLAPKQSNTTKSYLDYVLDKWLKDGYESRHSYTDVHAGLPLSPTDIPNYETDFRQV